VAKTRDATHTEINLSYRAVKFPFVADVTADDVAVFSSPELMSLATVFTDGLAKYLFDWKAPVSTKGLDEPSCFICFLKLTVPHSIQGCIFLSSSVYDLPSMGLELANLDSDFLYAIIFPWQCIQRDYNSL
jgi:hypothetical protein